MIIQVLLLIVGFILLIKGADIFVEGASKIALKFNIPQIVIGLTIVAFGTSAPEAAISITSGLKGSADLAVGNVIGSNIMNVLLILGITGCITRLKVKKNTYKYEIPFVVVITGVLLLLGYIGNSLSFIDGIIMWMFFLLFLYYLYRLTKSGEETSIDEIEELTDKDTTLRLIILLILGMAAIVGGSQLTINSCTAIATEFGIPQRIIGLTIVAFGTSLPELITSVTAAWKGKDDLSVGNIVGSNIFNILFVLGTTSLICPTGVPFQPTFILDGLIAIAAMVLFYVFIDRRKMALTKAGAIVMLAAYIVYFITLL
ncbi:MAG: calcium/sodium antiporter [Thomasclavelia sp.]|nr:calcium/sodium antiporter [Thomasclavelia sp.]